MSEQENIEKIQQFNEFFSIKSSFTINLSPIESTATLNYESFIEQMPVPFKIATDIVNLDQAALRPLQTLGSVAGQLVDYLNHQAQKIDLLVSYIISQQDNQEFRFQGTAFGGGGIIFKSKKTFKINDLLEVKIFLLAENCAVYCCGEIIEEMNDNSNDEDEKFYKVVFHHIREEDREILVRCSLHQQSKQLQQLSQERNQNK